MSSGNASANDALQDLFRIIQAAGRLASVLQYRGLCDPEQEIDHMRANLNHLAEEIRGGSR